MGCVSLCLVVWQVRLCGWCVALGVMVPLLRMAQRLPPTDVAVPGRQLGLSRQPKRCPITLEQNAGPDTLNVSGPAFSLRELHSRSTEPFLPITSNEDRIHTVFLKQSQQ